MIGFYLIGTQHFYIFSRRKAEMLSKSLAEGIGRGVMQFIRNLIHANTVQEFFQSNAHTLLIKILFWGNVMYR